MCPSSQASVRRLANRDKIELNGHRLVWWPFSRTSKRKIGPLDQGDGKAVVYEGVLLSEVLKQAGVPAGGGIAGQGAHELLLAEAADAFSLPEF